MLVQALQAGTPLNFGYGEPVDLTRAKDWPADRRVPGEALRAALLKSEISPDPRGLTIYNAYITGRADLADLRLPYGLSFNSCAFQHVNDWQRLTVTSLQLRDCRMLHLNLEGADIDGPIDLDGLVAIEVTARGASIGGNLSVQGATLTNEGRIALTLSQAEIKGVSTSRL